jgi:hypothetical protein
MSSPFPYRSLVSGHIDDLRRSVAASRPHRSRVASDCPRRGGEARRDASINSIRPLTARFAH